MLATDAELRRMFDLLHANMQPISPIPGDPDDLFAGWRDAWLGRRSQEDIRGVWDERDGVLCGFLLYSVDTACGVVSIDELQIRADRRRDGVTLRRLLRLFLDDLAALPCEWVRTYANKLNPVSPRLARKLGFEEYDETERGWRYQIGRVELLRALGSWRHT